jgi:large subunit ribosomal protein L25
VESHQLVTIAVPVHFKNEEASPGMKRGGALNIALHVVQLIVPADEIPEELVVDLTGMDLGHTIRASDLTLPKGASFSAHDRALTIASIGASGNMLATEGATSA